MSKRHRRQQPNAELVQTVATLATQVAELTRRISPAMLATGHTLPIDQRMPPAARRPQQPNYVQVQQKGDAAQGIPSTDLMNQMQFTQAPQADVVTMYSPGAPLPVVPGIEAPSGPRQRDYPVSYNTAALPRSSEATSFQELRALARLYYGVGLCERVWYDVLNRLVPKITYLPGVIPDGEADTDKQWHGPIQAALDFVAKPDRQTPLNRWLIMSVTDVLELGQSIIYKARNRKGEIIGLDVVDASMIKPLLDQRGRLPLPPYPAFQQFVKGIPAGLYYGDPEPDYEFNAAQMTLITDMSRTDSIYSRSRVEDVLIVINQALRLQNLNMARWTDGATPEGMLFVDPTYVTQGGNDDPENWEKVEQALNGVLAGNDRMRSRLKVIPPGLGNYQATRMEDPHTDFEAWLLKLTAGIFGVTMAELGITDDVNRSSGESQENVIYRRIVQPVANFYATFLTSVIQERFDPRLCLTWTGVEEREDTLQKAQTLDIAVKGGWLSPTTAAREMGWQADDEIPAFTLFNGGPQAVVIMKDLQELADMQKEQMKTQLQQAQVGVQTAQAGLKIQQDQGKMLDNQVAQANQPQEAEGEDYGDEGEGDQGEGGASEPEGNGGGAPPTPLTSPAPEATASTPATKDKNTSSASDEGAENDTDAEAQVDALIAKASKGKAQRVQVAEETRWQFNPEQPRGPNGKFMGSGLDERREAMYLARKLHEHAAATAGKPRSVAEKMDRALTWGRLTGAKAIQAHLGKLQAAARDGATQMSSLAIKKMQDAYLEMRAKANDLALPESERAKYYDEMRLLREHFDAYNQSLPPGIAKATLPIFGERAQMPDAWEQNLDGVAERTTTSVDEDMLLSALDAPSTPAAISDEWRRYREVALRAVKRGQAVPAFTSDVLPVNLHTYAAEALSRATTPDAVRAVFGEVREAETHPSDCRCMVCGDPEDDHQMDTPITPVVILIPEDGAPACPTCHTEALGHTLTGQWLPGMRCPTCEQDFAAEEPTNADMVAELRAMKADIAAFLTADYGMVRHNTPVFGAGHRIIGNIGEDGVFHPVGQGRERTANEHEHHLQQAQAHLATSQREVDRLHEHVQHAISQGDYRGPIHDQFHAAVNARNAAKTALALVQENNLPTADMANQIAYWRTIQTVHDLEDRTDDLERDLDNASEQFASVSLDASALPAEVHDAEQALQVAQTRYDAHLQALRDARNQLNANPVASQIRNLPPTIIRVNADSDHAMEAIFGRTLADQEFAALVGAQRGDLVSVTFQGEYILLHLLHPDDAYEAKRSIHAENGRVIVHNDAFVVEDGGQGLGARVFAAQVRGAAQVGADVIETTGGKGWTHLLGKSVNMNGYYTWPRLGYDADLRARFAQEAETDLGTQVDTVRDMMRTPEGREYWKDNGYQIDLSFDLAPGSESRHILSAYLAAKGMDNTGVERMQAPETAPQWVDLEWTAEDEAAANAVWTTLGQSDTDTKDTDAAEDGD